MPQFTQWNVPSPFPNVLFNPAAVDESIAKQQSELGTLDINRQRLGLEYQKLAQQREAGAALLGGGDAAGTGTTGASTGGGGPFLDALANIESGDKNIVSGVDKDSQGLTLAQGGNPSEISQGHFQIQTATWRDFAKQAGVDVNQYPTAMSAPREVQAQVASVIPLSRFGPRTQTLLRTRFGPLDTNQTVGALAGTPALTFAPGTAGPRVATAPPPPFNPNAGPRVAGAPLAGAPGAAPVAAPAAAPPQPGLGALTPVPGAPTVTGQADPASMEAVKKASIALLAMPEADAAVAYGPTVKALQAQGLAMNAPPVYPGHAALQAIVGQADVPAPVSPSAVALRTGGTDVAGPGAGPDTTLPPVAQPNRLYETGLPGIQITGPGNALAPPVAAAPATPPPAPVTAPGSAAPPGRPPILQPPPAPSRVIPMEPLIQSGPAAGLTDSQRRIAAAMITGGTPVADVGAHMAQWRQQNIAGQQQAATNAALEAQANFERQKYIREQQIEAEKTQYQRQQDAIKNQREEVAARNAGLPTGYRMSDDGKVTRIDGLPPDPAIAEAAKAAFDAKQREQPFQGTGTNEQNRNILIAGTKSGQFDTPEYASAYADLAAPRYNMDGSFVKPNMAAYAKPTFKPPGATEVPDYASQETPVPTIMNADQGRVAAYADRVREALPIISDTSDAAMNRWQMVLGKIPLGNSWTSPEFQLHQQSERNFINAVLRRESGAAIAPDEFVQARQQYIPQPGDSPQVLATKAANRATVLGGLTREAGPAYKPAASTGTATVKTPDEAAKLPTGTRYTTPDGRVFVR